MNKPKLVVFVVFPNIVLLDLVGPLQVFTHAKNPNTEMNAYTCSVVSHEGGMIETSTLVPAWSEDMALYEGKDIDTLLVVGGDGAYQASSDQGFLAKLKALSHKSCRVGSVCSGALVLAAAGLLNGKRATTHWEDCQYLAEVYPQVRVDQDAIFVQDERVWTSAGIVAGIDMALAMVAGDLGRAAALTMAKSLVMPLVRTAGQSQFGPVLQQQTKDTAGHFDELHQWIKANLIKKLTVESLAAKAGMSPRTFARVYKKGTGLTPAKVVLAFRVEAARDLLEISTLRASEIAIKTGFLDDERMRRAFIKLLKVSPSQYRDNFQSKTAVPT